jgi:PAS domain S-box-containing protein
MKLIRFKDWSIFAKVTALSVLGIVPFILLFFFSVLPSIEEQLYAEKNIQLTHNVEVTSSIISNYENIAKSGEMPVEEAQAMALALISQLRYDKSNYYWINDLEANMILHPISPELNGKSMRDRKDPNGLQLFVEFVNVAKNNGSGYVDYMWARPGYSEPVRKISYVKLHSDWGWVLGTGIYVNDVEEQLSELESGIYLFLFIAIAISLLAGYFIAIKISKPIKVLNEAAEKVAGGETEVAVEVNSKDEIGILSTSFNKMVEKIGMQIGYLNNIPTPIMIINKNFDVEYMNKMGAKITGSNQKSVIGKKCYDQFKTGHCNTDNCALAQAMKEDKVITKETIAKPNGKDMSIMYTGAPIKDKEGIIVGALEYVADISELKDKEEYLNRSTNVLLGAMDKFSEGDLTVNIIPENADDDIGKVFIGFTNSVAKINQAINEVLEAVGATASAANQISSSAEELAAGSQEQSAQTSEVATAIEQMAATITQTTQHVVQTNEAAKDSGDMAKKGQKVIEATIAGMKKIEEVVSHSSKIILELGDSSGQIGEIIQVINDIADQTNLLALNAAIEAARAGEQGRGFAVVADEVRKLAERTSSATNEIEGMVTKIQKDSKNAVDAIEQGNAEVSKGMEEASKAGESMAKIVQSSDEVLDISTQVATASEEQSATVEQISKSVEGINVVSQESAVGVQQVASASTDLSQLAENLQTLVSQFKLNANINTRTGNSETYAVKNNGTIVNQ